METEVQGSMTQVRGPLRLVQGDGCPQDETVEVLKARLNHLA